MTSEPFGSLGPDGKLQVGTFDGDLITCTWVDEFLSIEFYITLSLSSASHQSQKTASTYLKVGQKHMAVIQKMYDTIVYGFRTAQALGQLHKELIRTPKIIEKYQCQFKKLFLKIFGIFEAWECFQNESGTLLRIL
ncbi:5940_t:CDS:2 [Scutellospora calospora]|uniref:5940_t:CDS:1 n=1 Tax=Scutellospora calospora TaxID=85575 RepID=A0ACA9KD12_9GLOM|nr:5940_t:CDS:2 [Scutellospora calospora]